MEGMLVPQAGKERCEMLPSGQNVAVAILNRQLWTPTQHPFNIPEGVGEVLTMPLPVEELGDFRAKGNPTSSNSGS